MKEKYLKFYESYRLPFIGSVGILLLLIFVNNFYAGIFATTVLLFDVPYDMLKKKWLFLAIDILLIIWITSMYFK